MRFGLNEPPSKETASILLYPLLSYEQQLTFATYSPIALPHFPISERFPRTPSPPQPLFRYYQMRERLCEWRGRRYCRRVRLIARLLGWFACNNSMRLIRRIQRREMHRGYLLLARHFHVQPREGSIVFNLFNYIGEENRRIFGFGWKQLATAPLFVRMADFFQYLLGSIRGGSRRADRAYAFGFVCQAYGFAWAGFVVVFLLGAQSVFVKLADCAIQFFASASTSKYIRVVAPSLNAGGIFAR